jgi:HK97 family phage major capsid protein
MAEISRADAAALIATQNINEIVKEAEAQSAALSTFRTVRMSSKQARMPVLSALPSAGFVTELTDSTGIKPTSEVVWANKDLIAEEIAVIIPIHEDVLDDSQFDIWAEVRPLVAQEFGRVLDGAVFFGTNKPATWTDAALVPGAITAGNEYVAGSGTIGDLAEDVNGTFGLVEDDGFDVNVAYTGRFLRQQLRGLRDENNQPIYLDNIRSDGSTPSIYGQDLFYVKNGAWDRDEATLLAGDRSKAILGIRQDFSVKFLDQATVGTLNLAERDMVALRFKFRVAFAVATPVTVDGDDTDPYPFAVLTPAGS